MTNALHADWCYTDDFQLYIYNKKVAMNINNMQPQAILDMCTILVDTPQLSSDVTSTLVSNTWRIHNSNFQPFSFSVTFRDVGGLGLKNYFTEIWVLQQTEYFNDIKTEVSLIAGGKGIFDTSDCLISNISQSQFDNGNNQISEFTVEFTSPTISNKAVNNFGKYEAKGE